MSTGVYSQTLYVYSTLQNLLMQTVSPHINSCITLYMIVYSYTMSCHVRTIKCTSRASFLTSCRSISVLARFTRVCNCCLLDSDWRRGKVGEGERERGGERERRGEGEGRYVESRELAVRNETQNKKLATCTCTCNSPCGSG